MIEKSDTAAVKALLASIVGLTFGISALGGASFSVFVVPLTKAFGWGRGDISIALTIMSLTIIVAVPLAGFLVDKYGVRRILIPSTILFGLTLASLSLLSANIWHLYISYFLLALLGAATSPVTYSRVIVGWFDARRGLALGIALAGIGLGIALCPVIVAAISGEWGWRFGYIGLGLLVLCISLPLVAAWVREPPEQDTSTLIGARGAHGGYEFPQAIRSKAFILLTGGFTLLGVYTGGILGHLVPLLTDRGISSINAAFVASVIGVSLIVGRVVTGFMLDRFFAPVVCAVLLLGPVIGFAILVTGASPQFAVAAVVLIGLGLGAEMDFMSYLVSRYLGLKTFSRIYSLMFSVFTVGISIGPIIMGYSQQTQGSYDLALRILLMISIAAIAPFLLLGPYPDFQKQRDRPAGA